MRWAAALLWICTACVTSPHDAPPTVTEAEAHLDPATPSELNDALELFARSIGEQAFVATDPLERAESIASYELLIALTQTTDGPNDLFTLGDEAFEAERDRVFGFGIGDRGTRPALPARPQRLHTGEIGGLDSGSCRGCHFAGGPDGSGTLTQIALLRSNGTQLNHAVHRDAPHVMGLGYVSLIARSIEMDLQREAYSAAQFARLIGEPQTRSLSSQGVDFGQITVQPDGDWDTTQFVGVSPDLVVRPFGHKGRHRTLEALADEALQVHHGHQSTARIVSFAADPGTHLGPGSPFDPDNDGVVQEATGAQSLLLAGYLSMLPIPRMIPPSDPETAFAAGRGRGLLDTIGCTHCHKPSWRLDSYVTTIGPASDNELQFTIDLETFGQEPIPRWLDPAPTDPPGAGPPVFVFTDFRRHDMGPGLSEPLDETLPDGGGAVPGSVWLTRSLWGLADTAPYLHDGRAATVHEAILWHGGDAQDSRDAYVELPEADQAALRVFLMSLRRDPVVLVE